MRLEREGYERERELTAFWIECDSDDEAVEMQELMGECGSFGGELDGDVVAYVINTMDLKEFKDCYKQSKKIVKGR